MYVGDIVYLPVQGGFIKYVVKKIFDNMELLVITYKTKIQNCINASDVITSNDLKKIYSDEIIYE